MANEFESFDVNFKIISNKKEEVYLEGYITIPKKEEVDDEEINWYYWNGTGYQCDPFYWHDEEEITGLTIKQNNQIEEFKRDYLDDAFWIDTVIIQSEADENRTYVRENCTLIINEGAKFEVEIHEDCIDSDEYFVYLNVKFNGENIEDKKFLEMVEYTFDPYDLEVDNHLIIKNGKILFEISKSYFDDDLREDEIKIITQEMQLVYQAYLFTSINFEDDIFEQSLDSDLCEQEELFDLYLWANGDLTTQQFANRNGYEW